MTNAVHAARRLGQSIWYDNIRRGLIQSGELKRLIDLGISGLTSNPTIFEKAIAGSTDYDSALLELAQKVKRPDEIFEALAIEDIRAAADLLRPIYVRTCGGDGYASLEVSPHLSHDTEGTIADAGRLFAALDRPNVMVKVPATPEGVLAVRGLIARGINVNVTLIFSLDTYRDVAEAYIAGLEDLDGSGGDVSKVSSVASFFISRVDTAVDGLLEERIREAGGEFTDLLGKAAITNAKLAYREFHAYFDGERFATLRAKGARPQRPLWASTGTKNPAYSDVLYLESLIGRDTVNTVPEATLTSFLEHGSSRRTLDREVKDAEAASQSIELAGIHMEQIASKLLEDGLKAFADSYDKILVNLEDKMARLAAGKHEHPGASLGSYLTNVETALEELQQHDVIGRIWRKDHTVWRSDPREIRNRLGWLTVTDIMCEQIPTLLAFAEEVREAGFRHVVLLGMGGSSLGPEVLRQTFGSATGHPELIVLDSTLPARVQAVTDAIDPSRTLFLVSSKSGGSIEPNTLYAHFRGLADAALGRRKGGQSFVAITDPGTSLEVLALEQGFRRIFLNPPDIGGRYSVLSYFGLVPAAISGVDIVALLDRADAMREGCASCVAAHENHGAWLGAIMGVTASKGRDKLTLVTSPSIARFGLWAEQLIAESLGKQGKGIVPIAGEPIAVPDAYADDRLFVYLRVESDKNSATDAAVDQIESSGQPVVRLALRDKYDLGAEFFRWEFATAVAGGIIGVHPFNQPNVQTAKDMTDGVLQGYGRSGRLQHAETASSLKQLLSGARSGDYLAIMAYLSETPVVDKALNTLRRKVTAQYRVATTLGYGPRFLHSTGQLHKGGPASGIFLQLTVDHGEDVAVPSQPYTFGVLADAQALGDLQALQASGLRVVRVHLDSEVSAGIHSLVEGLAQ